MLYTSRMKLSPEAIDLYRDIGEFTVTPRDIDTYLEIFPFDLHSLQPGDKVLDVGSGINQELARGIELVKRGVKVYSIDPTLALPVDNNDINAWGVELKIGKEVDGKGRIVSSTKADRRTRLANHHKNVVIAFAPDKIPFLDDSFEAIFDLYGPAMYLKRQEDQVTYIKELYRMLAPGMSAFLFPVHIDDWGQGPRHKYETALKIAETRREMSGIASLTTFIAHNSNYDPPIGFKFTKC